jgi:hypothetical protein
MPQKTPSSRRLIAPLLLFTLAGWSLWALGRKEPVADAEPRSDTDGRRKRPTSAPARARARWSKRRMATSLAFVTLFFAGAAFSAGAGDAVVEALEGGTTTEEVTTEADAVEEEAPVEEQPAEEQPAEEEPAEEQPVEEQPAEEQPAEDDSAEDDSAEDPGQSQDDSAEGGEADDGSSGSDEPSGDSGQSSSDDQPADGGAGDSNDSAPNAGEGDNGGSDSEPDGPPLLRNDQDGPAELDPEAGAEGFFSTIWLHRTMPDLTPPAKRLTPAFAKTLAREASREGLDWAVVLAALRARGFDGGTTSTAFVRSVADRLAHLGARRNPWRAFLALRGRTSFADRALALTRYNRAVGLNALVTGLDAAKPVLQRKVLRDTRLHIYPGGRLDVALGRINVRVLVLMRYLAEAHGEVTVSSLFSGHRLYARPGVVSAHIYGLAVDISSLGGVSIAGHQGPNGLTERAIRNILLLPAELQPRQVISLLGLGGPSFPLANHWDHIHVGY